MWRPTRRSQIVGTAPEDLLGKTDADFYPQQLADEYRSDEEQVFRLGQPLVDKVESAFDSAEIRAPC